MEDAQQLMFHGARFAIERRNLNQALGKSVRSKNIVAEMLVYGSLRNDKNIECAVERSMEEEISKERMNKGLKPNPRC